MNFEVYLDFISREIFELTEKNSTKLINYLSNDFQTNYETFLMEYLSIVQPVIGLSGGLFPSTLLSDNVLLTDDKHQLRLKKQQQLIKNHYREISQHPIQCSVPIFPDMLINGFNQTEISFISRMKSSKFSLIDSMIDSINNIGTNRLFYSISFTGLAFIHLKIKKNHLINFIFNNSMEINRLAVEKMNAINNNPAGKTFTEKTIYTERHGEQKIPIFNVGDEKIIELIDRLNELKAIFSETNQLITQKEKRTIAGKQGNKQKQEKFQKNMLAIKDILEIEISDPHKHSKTSLAQIISIKLKSRNINLRSNTIRKNYLPKLK